MQCGVHPIFARRGLDKSFFGVVGHLESYLFQSPYAMDDNLGPIATKCGYIRLDAPPLKSQNRWSIRG